MRRPVLGVTGLPCAGKSLAAEILASGALTGTPGTLVKADDLGHAVLVRPEVTALLADRFGTEVLVPGDPAATRARIAGLVFARPGDLEWLESVVHPRVAAEVASIVGREGGAGPVAVEAALLFAAGMDRDCDLVLLVEAAFATRLARAGQRSWTREELERRDRRLAPQFEPARLEQAGGKVVVVQNDHDDGRLAVRMGEALKNRMNLKIPQA